MTNILNANSQLNWQPNSWRNLPIKQQPQYSNVEELRKVEAELANFPPLVAIDEIEKLKNEVFQMMDEGLRKYRKYPPL